ncbi:vWA domain-containing protein [Rubrimonas cliftonensis]|uniref:MxaL protein n=1 Tax=Rubrimonas cliftonensis TaxID=89524 RepID=A0A1H4FH95_9RHOB|nr:vWA domain-containing protein [Rubrimonas cliftonensis]SEA96655.1 mxaL protein [Rubrimonas cliftonensis]
MLSRAPRVAPPLAAAALAALAAANPRFETEVALRDVLMVVDVTRSMNARDMGAADAPLSRLAATRGMLTDWLARQPCGTRVGLAVFTERRTLTLLEPVEVCAEFDALASVLAGLDWRMAWEGDSMVARGLHHAMARAAELGVSVVFATDGHEAPVPSYAGPPRYDGPAATGVAVGVGGPTPAPIPFFDDDGQEDGFYGPNDVNHAPMRMGAPPSDAASRPGWHPRNNPYGEADLDGAEHLSALREAHLRGLATIHGLGYARLSDGPEALSAALVASAPPRVVSRPRALGWLAAAAGLAALALAYLPAPGFGRRAHRPRSPA